MMLEKSNFGHLQENISTQGKISVTLKKKL